MTEKTFTQKIPEELVGKRLDQVIMALLPDYSRSLIQTWIKKKLVTVNGGYHKQNYTSKLGDIIHVEPTMQKIQNTLPEPILLNILYEDQALIIINKPAGFVVHPGAGNHTHTLVNALLYYDAQLQELPRAGIIHRLDKDTTGIMIVARNYESYYKLVSQMEKRQIQRQYQAIVNGQLLCGGSVIAPIGRHPSQRTKMAVCKNGKTATTHYRIIERFQHYTHLQVQLETGRTHQIRVHMAHKQHPVLGDPLYNKRIPQGLNPQLIESIKGINRQILHAHKLCFNHPIDQQSRTFEAPIPEDFKQIQMCLKKLDAVT